MIAASSAFSGRRFASTAAATATESRTKVGWHFSPVPDLNTDTWRQIGQSGAGWTFTTITRLVHHVGRVGRPAARAAARDDHRLGVGLAAIARESGQSEGKVRSDLGRLQKLGVIVRFSPNVVHVRDPESGRLTENRTGRSKATQVILTIRPAHLRQPSPDAGNPANRAGLNPANRAGLADPVSVKPCRAIQTESNAERRPDGQPAGSGRPPAAPEAAGTTGDTGTATDATGTPTGLPDASQGRLAAAGAGRLPAAVFEGEGSEFLRRVTADPESAGFELPPDRILPQRPDPAAAERRAAIERRDRLVRDYAYHLGLAESAVIELWQADKAELRRRLIAAGVDPDTGKPRRRSPVPDEAGEPSRPWTQADAQAAALAAIRDYQRHLAADFIPDEVPDAAGTGVGAAESVTPDA